MDFKAILKGREWQISVSEERDGVFRVLVDGREMIADCRKMDSSLLSLILDGLSYEVSIEDAEDGIGVVIYGHRYPVRIEAGGASGAKVRSKSSGGPLPLFAPMPGKVVKLFVREGEEVKEGQGLVVIEAMKMENDLPSPKNGRVREILVKEGDAVEAEAVLLVVE